MFRVKFVAESSRQFFNFEAVRRVLVFLLINFMEENAYLRVYLVSRRYMNNLENFLIQEFLHGKDLQKLITS